MASQARLKGPRAEVLSKWTRYLGSIDSALRYKPPRPVFLNAVETDYLVRLVLTNKHREISAVGTAVETTGPWEWKIEDPPRARSATVSKAIAYVRAMRDKSNDTIIRKNATETLVILRRLQKTGGADCAC